MTGAGGRIGPFLRRGLPGLGWQLRLLDRVPIEGAEDAVVGDIRDQEAMARALEGVDAVVHLAAIADEASFQDILGPNIEGTHQVFESARRAGVRRVVFFSSNHAVGFTPRAPMVGDDVPPRPDGFYGLSKVFGEALGRLYVDRYGMQVACLRVGTCIERPSVVRHLSTWLSPGDVVRLVHACLAAPELDYAVLYGISRNTRRWWDIEPARRLGYEPQDDSEVYAEEVLAANGELAEDDPEYAFIGGSYADRSRPLP
jgi:uronate dehydrogenase